MLLTDNEALPQKSDYERTYEANGISAPKVRFKRLAIVKGSFRDVSSSCNCIQPWRLLAISATLIAAVRVGTASFWKICSRSGALCAR